MYICIYITRIYYLPIYIYIFNHRMGKIDMLYSLQYINCCRIYMFAMAKSTFLAAMTDKFGTGKILKDRSAARRDDYIIIVYRV